MSLLALSTSFEYICYGSTTIINVLIFQPGIDFRHQNLTKVDYRPGKILYIVGEISVITHYKQRYFQPC